MTALKGTIRTEVAVPLKLNSLDFNPFITPEMTTAFILMVSSFQIYRLFVIQCVPVMLETGLTNVIQRAPNRLHVTITITTILLLLLLLSLSLSPLYRVFTHMSPDKPCP